MRKPLLLMMILFGSFLSYGQSYEIEGLRKVINEHPQQDTFRVNRLNEICNLSPIIPKDEMEKLAAEALLVSRKLNYAKGEGYSLLSVARATNRNGNTKEAATFLQQADSIAKQIGDQRLQWWVMARSNALNTDLRLFVSGLLKAEAFALQINSNELLTRSQSLIATLYYSLGDYALALEYGIKALKNIQVLNNTFILYNIYDNLASIHSLIGEYEKANLYLQKQPALIRQLGLGDRPLANLYNSLGENARLQKKICRSA